jgi:uncharacterized protein
MPRVTRRPFHMMAKPTGSRSNIACDSCFYLEKDEGTLRESSRQQHMDDGTLDAYVKGYIEANPSNEVDFLWQGGEPTLAGIGFFEKALAAQRRYAAGKTISNSIQTNGLLIDERWARFLADNRFLVGLSVDGPAHLHDKHRVARNGKGVHAEVINALVHLKAAGVEYNLLVVVNATTAAHPKEIYDYLTRDLGGEFLQFIPAVEQRLGDTLAGELAHPQTEDRSAKVTSWSVSGDAYGEFLIGVFDEWVRSDVGRVFVQIFDNALAAWSGQGASLCVMQPTCGNALVVEKNGDVYSCDHYVYPQHRLGNVKRSPLAAMVDSKQQKGFGMSKANLPKACHDCDWRFTCHGGCPKHRIHRVSNHWHNHLCSGYKLIFSHIDPYMRHMASELRNGRPPSTVMLAAEQIMASRNAPEPQP